MFGFGGGNKSDNNDNNGGGGGGNGRHGEASPLLLSKQTSAPSNASGSERSNYYFLGGASGRAIGTSDSVRDADGGEVVEGLPQGATTDEFAPKVLGIPATQTPSSKRNLLGKDGGAGRAASAGGRSGGGIWAKVFGLQNPGGGGATNTPTYGEVGTLVRQRKAPIKIEPKVFFANERTFLAWMHLSVILAGASIAILAFSEQDENPLAQLYGIMILPVAIAFIVYAMYQYGRRAYMIRNRHPGPYEDTVGPTVLGIMLMISIIGQFLLKLYSMTGAY